jgi:anti-sigma regulatory factor (Ser/Thr protein kinase)
MRQAASFAAIPASVAGARRFATNAVQTLPRDVRDAVSVIVSELVTNSVRHGSSTFELRIVDEPGRILIEVEDDSAGEPVLRSAGPLDTSGRGLQIVRELSDNWGIANSPGRVGKTVWAVVGLRESSGAETALTQRI